LLFAQKNSIWPFRTVLDRDNWLCKTGKAHPKHGKVLVGSNYPLGELDVPGPENGSASNNASVPIAFDELRTIYRSFGVENRVQMQVSPGKGHEMDIPLLLKYFA
jgi:hypothetical protein